MKQEDWTQYLRQQLDNHKEAVPEGLWTDIEAALDRQAKHPTLFIRMRRWAVAAAVTIFVIGGGFLLWPQGEHTQLTECAMAAADVQAIEDEEEVNTPWEEQTEEGIAAEVPQPAYAPLPKTAKHEDADEQQVISEEKEVSLQELADEQETVLDNGNAVETDTPSSQSVPATPVHHQQILHKSNPSRHITLQPSPRQMTLHLYASNYAEDRFHRNQVLMAPQLAQQFTNAENTSSARLSAPIYLTDYQEQEHHYQPVSLGLTLSYPVTNRLSISTGIVYTWQHSTFLSIMPSAQIKTEQKLHYLGMPLNLHYQLLQLQRFSIYLSAGTQADFNVSTTLSTDGVSQSARKDRCQWSVNGSLGVAYRLLPRFSLYAEPGARHYFDNGSEIKNAFKDQPTSFNLQLGFRLHF